ncbi:hypothetical protein B0H17DRAFT_1137053 [Mycena rosella]|uniref:Uncharacterized protein n=1 Tax=Mycena rosella TaxID=1033263 RepID=A0AAD7GB88_MYCRO|nr:hypothetical protein B0H17DRAFT_1137053 [Mycena rosella]
MYLFSTSVYASTHPFADAHMPNYPRNARHPLRWWRHGRSLRVYLTLGNNITEPLSDADYKARPPSLTGTSGFPMSAKCRHRTIPDEYHCTYPHIPLNADYPPAPLPRRFILLPLIAHFARYAGGDGRRGCSGESGAGRAEKDLVKLGTAVRSNDDRRIPGMGLGCAHRASAGSPFGARSLQRRDFWLLSASLWQNALARVFTVDVVSSSRKGAKDDGPTGCALKTHEADNAQLTVIARMALRGQDEHDASRSAILVVFIAVARVSDLNA